LRGHAARQEDDSTEEVDEKEMASGESWFWSGEGIVGQQAVAIGNGDVKLLEGIHLLDGEQILPVFGS
jgi:hypothetical protein